MTLAEALQITGIRESELDRLDIERLNDVIKYQLEYVKKFPYMRHYSELLTAYQMLRDFTLLSIQ